MERSVKLTESGSAAAPRDGVRHHRHASRARRESASLDRIATSRAPSTDTVNEAHRPEEKGALRRTHCARALSGRGGASGRRPRPALSVQAGSHPCPSQVPGSLTGRARLVASLREACRPCPSVADCGKCDAGGTGASNSSFRPERTSGMGRTRRGTGMVTGLEQPRRPSSPIQYGSPRTDRALTSPSARAPRECAKPTRGEATSRGKAHRLGVDARFDGD